MTTVDPDSPVLDHLALPRPPRSWRKGYIVGAVILLLLPLVAMAITAEVTWGSEDFLAAAGLLVSLWLGVETVWRVLPDARFRALGMIVVLALTVLAWAQLAVGIF